MPSSPAPHTAAPHRAGLVAVDGRTFPLAGADLRARAGGGLAATTLVQRYRNPYADPLEVLYTLPLPADGAVTGYTIRAGARVIRGTVERRETAHAKYREALIAGKLAGLLEQERADTFTQSLGSLAPGVEVEVTIEVLHPLAFLAGDDADGARPAWEYRFPTVAGVRYQGEPGRVPDRERLDVERADGDGTPVRVSFELLVADGGPAALAARSTTHALDVAAATDDAAAAGAAPGTRLAFREARLDRDVAVRWNAVADAVGAALREGPGLAGDDGRYALLTLTPPAVPAAIAPRDLTLLIDASGSMSGAPIETAKRIATALLRSLAPHDRFEVIAFADAPQPLTTGVVAASETNVHRALRALAELRAGGATKMASALRAALAPLRPDAQRQVVLLTDGEIGFEREIVGRILDGLPEGARLHTVGIGSAPNRALTRPAARAGRGIELLVGNDDDARTAAQRLVHATAAPVLTGVRVGGSAVVAVVPERARDVFAGAPLLLALELHAAGGTVEVEGTLAGQREPWRTMVDVPDAASRPADALPAGALFGREALEDCEMRLAAALDRAIEPTPLFERIEQLGLRHRLASRRTSLVAIAEEPSVDPAAPRRRERLAVEMPAEVSAEGVGLAWFSGAVLNMPLETVHQVDYCEARPSVAKSRRVGRSAPPPPAPDPDAPGTIVGRVLQAEPQRMVIEFEAPSDGFVVPGRSVELRAGRVPMVTATLDPADSTRPGSVTRGLTVRLVLVHFDSAGLWGILLERLAMHDLAVAWPTQHGHVVCRLVQP